MSRFQISIAVGCTVVRFLASIGLPNSGSSVQTDRGDHCAKQETKPVRRQKASSVSTYSVVHFVFNQRTVPAL